MKQEIDESTPDISSAVVDNDQLPSGSFRDMDIPEQVISGLTDLGYVGPTPVQRETFEKMAAGKDLIVQAKTGSGKTTAFGLPMVVRLGQHDPDNVRALVLCPTRELARQVAKELTAIAKHTDLRLANVYGGTSFDPQLKQLKQGVDIIVGTPGRVRDHIRRGTLRVKAMQVMVLDEADEMLSMGFWDEVTGIMDQLGKGHQTALFSATLPTAIQRAAAKYLREPERIELSGDDMTVSGIANVVYRADDSLPKPRNFLHIIEAEKPDSALIFCNRRDETQLIYNVLRRFGFRVGLLNSDLSQGQRERVMAQVKSGELPLLVATDVAARGIDISDLSHVFNYDFPEHIEVYLHRAGRTGRIGTQGTAVSLVRGLSTTRKREIERTFDVNFLERSLPETEKIVEIQTDRILQTLAQDAKDVETGQYQALAQALINRDSAVDAVALLLRNYFSDQNNPGQSAGHGRVSPLNLPAKVFVDLGSEAGLDEDKLRQVLVENTNVQKGDIIGVEIFSDHSRVDIDTQAARELAKNRRPLETSDGLQLNLRVEVKPARRPHRGPRSGGQGHGGRRPRRRS